MELGLGFDTGGTYTDAVLMNFLTGEIISKAKALTTRENLTIGILNSLRKVNKEYFKDIVMVSLSSTLATNSIVEGKGCRVGLVSVGRDYDNSIPVNEYARITGGHNLSGKEVEPLDEDAARKFFQSIEGKVDGLAITSYLSVRNPDHENRLSAIAKEIIDVPVVCGHQLSSSLGFNERTITSIMNARLIPIIKELIDSVKDVMREMKIDAPLMIVKGDGSIMSEKIALERPIETILSGPAASLIGAKILTGKKDAIVMDMGGTTTDIGILRNGQPRLEKEGAVIGGRRTRVLAAEISTSGIGGDSRIIVNGGKFVLSPLRVVPLCIATSEWPQLEERLKSVAEAKSRFTPESLDVNNIVQDIEYFVKLKDIKNRLLSDADEQLLDYVSKEPFSLKEAGEALGIHPFIFNVSKMEELGMIQRIGLTPTDLLHAERSYVEYNEKASDYGIIHQAFKLKMEPTNFIAFAKNKVIEKLSEELLRKLFFEENDTFDMGVIALDLMKKSITGEFGLDYRCKIKLNKPIIGIGAPVAAYFPIIAEKFETELLLPEYSEVGNAVGAISGSVVESIDILIKPFQGEGAVEDPRCTVFASFGRQDFEKLTDALVFTEKIGREKVTERAKKAGADFIETNIDTVYKKYGFGDQYQGEVLIEIQMKVTAVGKPKQFIRKEKSSYYSDLQQSWDM